MVYFCIFIALLNVSIPFMYAEESAVLTLDNTSTVTKPAKVPVLYAHGFGGSKLRRILYVKGYERVIELFFPGQKNANAFSNHLFDRDIHTISSFNFNDIHVNLGVYGSIPNPIISHLAQENDILMLQAHIDSIKSTTFVGFGVSRGAATWLTTLSSNKINKKPSVLILESPFAHIKNIGLYNFIKYYVECVQTIIPSIHISTATDAVFSRIFQQHNLDGIQPINAIKNIDPTIPIMLVHSQQDRIIPINDSRALYIELKKAGCEHVYLVELAQGDHASILWGRDGELYRNIVHAFYKKYGLPHNTTYAGNIKLESYQPSIQHVQSKIKNQR